MAGGARASPRCHECHGPVGDYHAEYPHGIGKCPLQHYDFCVGGITEGKDKGGHMWKGCPLDYVASEEIEDDDNTKSPTDSSFDSAEGLDDGSSLASGKPATREKAGAKNKQKPKEEIPDGLKNQEPTPPQHFDKLKEDLLLEAELAELALAEERLDKLKQARERRQKAEEDFHRLSRQSQGEGARRKIIMETVDSLRVDNTQPEVSRRDGSSYKGPTMSDMRRDTRTRDNVEQLLSQEVHSIPALSSANNSNSRGQPRLKVAAISDIPVNSVPGVPQEQLYRWESGVDRYGVEYRTLVEVTPVKLAVDDKPRTLVSMGDGWVYDEDLGRAYKSHSQRHTSPLVRRSSRDVLTQDRYRTSSTPPRHGRPVLRSPYRERRNQSDVDRYTSRGYMDSAKTDREGKAVSIADHARMLPLECARSVNSKNINFAMFMYGAIKELHSARIGTDPVLEPGVLEAKLQHLMNVLHVSLLNSTSSDFKPIAWSVGRTYNNLVQAKVESGRESWLDFDQLHRGSPHASEMVAAEREHRSALAEQLKPKKEAKKVDKTEKSEKTDREKKSVCSSWNSSEVEGKCKWEAEHSGSKCYRAHYCSYCEKKTGNTRTNHQEKFCYRKQEDDK